MRIENPRAAQRRQAMSRTIAVIERPAPPETDERPAATHPFGFSRALRDRDEEQLVDEAWEGQGL